MATLVLPAVVDAARRVVGALDEGLVTGLGRLGAPARDALEGLGGLFRGTPLEAKAVEASAAIQKAMPTEEHVLALAACRASLLGAAHDALLAHACEALGRPAPEPSEGAPLAALAPEDAAPLRNARHWLLELALGGLAQVSVDAVAPFASSLAQISERPLLHRAAALLTGFHDELVDVLPLASADEVPTPRWPDLWSASVLATAGPRAAREESVRGTFRPLGVDLRHHDHVLSAVVYGVLEAGVTRVVRATFSAWKVDALSLAEVVRALPAPAAALLGAATGDQALAVEGRLRGAELIVDAASESSPSDPFALGEALATASSFAVAPEDRHPVQIALPLVLGECRVSEREGALVVAHGSLELRVAEERVSPAYGATSALAEASSMIGLVRFDGDGWALQPLAARLGKKKAWGLGSLVAAAKSPAKSGEPLDVLRERAGMLLRQS